ncbi:hypothetical protein T190611E02C_40295 [Tenacibaculum sp. 190524A05c]|uniref:hypothetical protein n=1 Tax=Tenacibaculum platacis TaxID=3137852 RepID=UPI0031FA6FDA
MKLIANNFKGFLSNGDKYRVEIISQELTVMVSLKTLDRSINFWDTKKIFIERIKLDSKTAIRKALDRIEAHFNIKLTNTDLKAA